MKKTLLWLLISVVVLAGCGEYNTVMKYGDQEYKYEYAKAAYVQGKYTRAYELFNELIIPMNGFIANINSDISVMPSRGIIRTGIIL